LCLASVSYFTVETQSFRLRKKILRRLGDDGADVAFWRKSVAGEIEPI